MRYIAAILFALCVSVSPAKAQLGFDPFNGTFFMVPLFYPSPLHEGVEPEKTPEISTEQARANFISALRKEMKNAPAAPAKDAAQSYDFFWEHYAHEKAKTNFIDNFGKMIGPDSKALLTKMFRRGAVYETEAGGFATEQDVGDYITTRMKRESLSDTNFWDSLAFFWVMRNAASEARVSAITASDFKAARVQLTNANTIAPEFFDKLTPDEERQIAWELQFYAIFFESLGSAAPKNSGVNAVLQKMLKVKPDFLPLDGAT